MRCRQWCGLVRDQNTGRAVPAAGCVTDMDEENAAGPAGAAAAATGNAATDTVTDKTEEQQQKQPWMQRLCDRFKINRNLVMLKLTLFVFYGATSSLLPYLTIHMQSVGLTIEEIGMIYLALPFTTFMAPPLTGFLVDKFGKYKPVVIISFLLNALVHHSLLMIPHMETPGIVPPGYVMRHPNTGAVEVWWSPCPSRECPEEEELDLVLDMCVDHCILRKGQDGVFMHTAPSNMKQVDYSQDMGDADDLIFHLGKKYKNMTKTGKPKKKDKKNEIALNDSSNVMSLLVDMHPDLGDPVEVLGIELEQDEDNDSITDFKQRFGEKLLYEAGVNVTALEEGDLRCGGIVLKANVTYETRLKEWAGDCMVQKCQFRQGGPGVCPPDYKESDDKIFWIYFVLRFTGTVLLSAGITIMDPIALTMIEKYGGDFGREKLFSSFGMALFSPITGFFIDMNSRRLGYTDYSAAFYTYDILLVTSSITVYLMPLGDKLPADDIFKNLMNILKMPIVLLFILFLFVLGNLWGFIESFLFLYLRDLGAPNYLLGITVTVGTVSSMPFLYGAERITKKIGHVNIIIIAFFAHAGRLVGYSIIESAWWCFPFEAMESLSVHLMWVAAATYCALLAPKNLLATLIGVVGMVHFSLGRGSGSFFGGHLIGKIGIRESFRTMGLVAVTAGVVYAILHMLWLRKMNLPGLEKTDEEILESGETEKLKNSDEPKYKNAATMVSYERLSLMIKYNQIGSLTSLGRSSRSSNYISRTRSSSIRRGSCNTEMFKTSRSTSSKVDFLNNSRNSNLNKGNNSLSRISQKSYASIPEIIPSDAKRDSILEDIAELADDKIKKENNNNVNEKNDTSKVITDK